MLHPSRKKPTCPDPNCPRSADFRRRGQAALRAHALAFREANTHTPDDYPHFKKIVKGGFARAHLCGSANGETTIKEETKAAIRCIPLEQDNQPGACFCCSNQSPSHIVAFRPG